MTRECVFFAAKLAQLFWGRSTLYQGIWGHESFSILGKILTLLLGILNPDILTTSCSQDHTSDSDPSNQKPGIQGREEHAPPPNPLIDETLTFNGIVREYVLL